MRDSRLEVLMTSKSEPMYAVLPRFFWMMLGPAILGLIAIHIADEGNTWFGNADIGFYAVLAGVVLARWLDFQLGDPKTAYGQPATTEMLMRYVPAAILCGVGVWIIAKLAGRYSAELV